MRLISITTRLGSLERFLHEVTGVEEVAVLAYLSDGRRLRDENLRELAGAVDQVWGCLCLLVIMPNLLVSLYLSSINTISMANWRMSCSSCELNRHYSQDLTVRHSRSYSEYSNRGLAR